MSDSFIDTNVVIYSLSQDELKQKAAIALLAKKPVISVQVLSETANVMRKKLGFDISSVRIVVDRIANECTTIQPLTIETLRRSLDLSERYGFSHFDGLIIASALDTDCTKFYSEDMHHESICIKRL
ncbi:MAG: PIN domain-containing protein [Candidatus Thiosymbion ectosymbiont of Robbea hypermnestra]|nr:PIN domain-containing protein [Candidatus Thiosymbion ectosymbiont of Robbea hypermnestra]